MNSSLGLFNASAAIASQPVEVPPLVSFRSVTAFPDKEPCPYGYQWTRFGCLRAIYDPVQKPGMVYKAFGLGLMPTNPPRGNRTPYTLPPCKVAAAPQSRNDNDQQRQQQSFQRDPAPPANGMGHYVSDFGTWTVNKPPKPMPQPKPMPKTGDLEANVIIIGDISEETPLPKWEPKWKRKPRTSKNYFKSKFKFNPNNL